MIAVRRFIQMVAVSLQAPVFSGVCARSSDRWLTNGAGQPMTAGAAAARIGWNLQTSCCSAEMRAHGTSVLRQVPVGGAGLVRHQVPSGTRCGRFPAARFADLRSGGGRGGLRALWCWGVGHAGQHRARTPVVSSAAVPRLCWCALACTTAAHPVRSGNTVRTAVRDSAGGARPNIGASTAPRRRAGRSGRPADPNVVGRLGQRRLRGSLATRSRAASSMTPMAYRWASGSQVICFRPSAYSTRV